MIDDHFCNANIFLLNVKTVIIYTKARLCIPEGMNFHKISPLSPFFETFQKINLLWNTQPPLKDDDGDNL